MNDHEAILRSVPLFDGIRPDEWERMLGCLGAVHRRYPAGEFILMAGQPADRVGVLLEGRAQVLREEFSGARTILTALAPGDLFAEAFACASGGGRTLPVSVLATSDCRVLLIDYRENLPPVRRPAIFTRGWSGTCWPCWRTKTCSSTAG